MRVGGQREPPIFPTNGGKRQAVSLAFRLDLWRHYGMSKETTVGTTFPQRKINAWEAAREIRSGMPDPKLMEKYGLSSQGVKSLKKKLVEAGMLRETDLGAPQDSPPRAEALPDPAKPTAPIPIASRALPPEDEEEDPPRPLEVRTFWTEEWIALAVGIFGALLCFAFFWPYWILGVFRILVHEMGHFIFGWAFGYPSAPAFDIMHGGGVTLHTQRSWLILVVIYFAFGALVVWLRRNTLAVALFCAVALVHLLLTLTRGHDVVILAMGHGTELIIGGLFIYQALASRAIVHPAERPVYAIIGFFLVFSDVKFSFDLLWNPMFQEEYLAGKGGCLDNDFVRIARDIFGCPMSRVTAVFLACTILTPLMSFLAFRYEEFVHSAIVRALSRGGDR